MSSNTNTIVANLAIGHLGKGKPIADLDTEDSSEARACRLYYDHAVKEFLRDFPWPFCTRFVALGLVTDNGDDDHPTQEYVYSYRYPSNCLFARKIESGVRNDTRFSEVHYRVISDDQGKLILTDKEEAILQFTSTDGLDEGLWDEDFIMALSFRLAAYTAPLITGGDPFKVGEKSLMLWNGSNRKAKANAANEQKDEDIPAGELINARY